MNARLRLIGIVFLGVLAGIMGAGAFASALLGSPLPGECWAAFGFVCGAMVALIPPDE